MGVRLGATCLVEYGVSFGLAFWFRTIYYTYKLPLHIRSCNIVITITVGINNNLRQIKQ
jgi:hypothetical protein